MTRLRVLSGDWKEDLASLINCAQRSLLLCSPFVGRRGIELVADTLSPRMRSAGEIEFLTNLSPTNICQGSTDPDALLSLVEAFEPTRLWHLPGLHAKVFLADGERAIVTSGNLTEGGLVRNYECGVRIQDRKVVRRIDEEMRSYAALGAPVSREQLSRYCRLLPRLRASFEKLAKSFRAEVRRRFEDSLEEATDDLIRMRLAGGPIHTVFTRTIEYLLRTHGRMNTKYLHLHISRIHPDLCDDTVDRVIDGQHYGKKWKHAVRTAQQHLKSRGLLEYRDGLWCPVAGRHPSV